MAINFGDGNLCGASPELNSVLSKLDEAKAEITSKIDEAASTAAAAFKEAEDELAGLKDKLQTIEIPTLPKLNLQSEIKSLTDQIPGTPSFFSALAKIKTEFGDDLEAAGLELDSLVSSATAAISGGGNLCDAVPNLVKEAGSDAPAQQESIAVKQAAAPAVAEPESTVHQVFAVEQQFANLQNKVSSFFTGSKPPDTDTPAFQFTLPSSIKKISLGGGAPTSVAFPPTSIGERTNYTPSSQGDGFAHKQATITETFSLADVVQEPAGTVTEIDGDGNEEKVPVDAKTYVRLKHKPVRIKQLLFHTGTGVSKGYWNRQQRSIFGLDPNIESTDANKGFYYRNQYGRHADLLIATGDYPTIGANEGTNWSAFGNQFNFFPPVKLADHPGNISSGGTVLDPDPDIFVVSGVLPYAGTLGPGQTSSDTRRLSDAKLNSKYQGMCVSLTYSYMERYDPEYVPSKTPPKENTPVPASAPAAAGGEFTAEDFIKIAEEAKKEERRRAAQPTVPTPLPPPTVAAPEPAKPPPSPKKTPPAELVKIKSDKDRIGIVSGISQNDATAVKASLTKILVERYGGKYKIRDDKKTGYLRKGVYRRSGSYRVKVIRNADGKGYGGISWKSYEEAMFKAIKLLEKNPDPPKKRKRIKSYTPPHDGKPAVTVYHED